DRAQAGGARIRRGTATGVVSESNTGTRVRHCPDGQRTRRLGSRGRGRRPHRRRAGRRHLRSAGRVVNAEPSFEEAQRELESIVERLERGQAPLGEALGLWERGEELYRLCRGKLDSAQGRIEELGRRIET